MEITKKIVAIILACFGMPAHASDSCVFAVPGGEPTHSLERRQTYRIVGNSAVVPGFNGIVMSPSNRANGSPLLHFDGKEILPISGDFPHRSGHTLTHGITPAIDGMAFGFGSDPRVIFVWKEGNNVWIPIDQTRDYKRAVFDSGSGEVFVFGKNKNFTIRESNKSDLKQLEDVQKRICSTPNTSCDLLSIRSHKESAIRFATFGGWDSNSIWFRLRAGSWKEIAIPRELHLLKDLNDAKIISDDTLIKILPKYPYNGLLLRKTDSGLEFIGSLPPADWHYHKPSGDLVGWSSYVKREKRTWLGIRKKYNYDPPELYHLAKGKIEAQAITLKRSLSSEKPYSVFVHPKTIYHSIYSKTPEGLVVFDGENFVQPDSLSTDAIGSPMILSFEDRAFVQSNLGLFELFKDLSVRRIDSFPVAEPWGYQVNIIYLSKSNIYIITDEKSGLVYSSKDLKRYTEVASEGYIFRPASINGNPRRFATISSNPESVLLIGRDGLYAFSQNCQHVK